MHTCTDACTYSDQGMRPEEERMGHACRAIKEYTCLLAAMQRWGVRWIWIHVLMHVHTPVFHSFVKKRDFLLLITSCSHLSTRGNVNL